MNIYIVIPVYNEEKKIADVISDVFEHYKNIVAVNDGSTDKTVEILRNIKEINVCAHLINRGQGASLKTGTRFALDRGADIIVHFDADGQMRVSDIEKLIKPIAVNECEVVLGSRFMDIKSNIPPFRKLILKLAGIFNKYILGINLALTDPQSGFRVMSASAARQIEITQDRMAHCSEILLEIKRKALRVKEVPVKIEYSDYSMAKGQKSSNAFRIAWSLFVGRFMK